MSSELDLIKELTNLPESVMDEDAEESRVEPFVVEPVNSNINKPADDVRYDYAVVRGSLHVQHQMLLEAARVALEFARNTENPRAFDSFSGIMDRLSKVNTNITEFHQEMIKLEKERRELENKNSEKVVNTEEVYYGNPMELMSEHGSLTDVRRAEAFGEDE